MRCEKLRRDAGKRGLAAHGLGTVLAELRHLAFAIGVRPSAARAIETVFLVHVQERAEAALDAHLTAATLEGLVDRIQTRGARMSMHDFGALRFERRLRAGYATRQRRIGRRLRRTIGLSLRAVFVVLAAFHQVT